MGYAVGSVCVASVGEAAAISCAAAYPVAGASTVTSCLGADQYGRLMLSTATADGTTELVVPTRFPQCQVESGYEASAELGVLVMCAVAILWLWRAALVRPLMSNV